MRAPLRREGGEYNTLRGNPAQVLSRVRFLGFRPATSAAVESPSVGRPQRRPEGIAMTTIPIPEHRNDFIIEAIRAELQRRA